MITTSDTMEFSVSLILNSSPSSHKMMAFCTAVGSENCCLRSRDWGESHHTAHTFNQFHWFLLHAAINWKVLFFSRILAWLTPKSPTNLITCYTAFTTPPLSNLTSILSITDLCLWGRHQLAIWFSIPILKHTFSLFPAWFVFPATSLTTDDFDLYWRIFCYRTLHGMLCVVFSHFINNLVNLLKNPTWNQTFGFICNNVVFSYFTRIGVLTQG